MVVFTFSDFADVKVPYEMIGLTDFEAATCTYSKTRGSAGAPVIKGFVFPLQGVASGPGGQAAPLDHVLSMHVKTDVTVGVTPDGKRFRVVSCAAVTLGLA